MREAIYSMISCRASGDDIRFIPFAFSGHFALFADIFAPFPDIVRRCPQLPVRAVPSCLPLSRAVCLKKIAPPIGWDGRGDLVENDGVPRLTVIEHYEDGFWQKKFPNKSVASE